MLGCGHISHTVKNELFLFSLLTDKLSNVLYSRTWFKQMTYSVMVNQNYTFPDPSGRGSDAKAWPYKSL